MPPGHTWVHSWPVRPGRGTPLTQGFASPTAASRHCPSASAALVPARADGTSVTVYHRVGKRSALGSASDPQALRSAVREHGRGVYAESNGGGRMPTSCKPGQTLRKQRVILTPYGLDHASCTTHRQSSGKQGTGSWIRQELVLNHGSSLGRLTFISNVSSVRQPVGGGRRSCRQPCHSYASPNSATQWLSDPGRRRLLIVSSRWMLTEILEREN